ncbi:MAG: hypothetical protein JWO45_518 [Spartobacteria bacterium]|jgi:hypothetical protein|nr:hypothetical protein [Spartobacteria bacterium]
MKSVLFHYRVTLGLFIIGLVISGLTTFPLRFELSVLTHIFTRSASNHTFPHGLARWIQFVDSGVRETYSRFPFFGYATDWLGFGHFVIAAFFILPFMNPERYRAVLYIGLAACGGVILVALICGRLRGIPLYWQFIDCSFGVFGAAPLIYCLRLTKRTENVA